VEHRGMPGRGLSLLSGVLGIIAGLILLFWPAISILTLAFLAGIWLIVLGITQFSLAMQLRPILVEHRNAVLMTSDRTMMAHLLYQLRDFAPDHVAWAPNAFPADHYQLTTPLTEASSARPLLFVTQDDSYADITARFAHNEVLAIINVMVEPGLERHATVLLLEGFQGYAKPTVTQ